jgi:hypothetical protein
MTEQAFWTGLVMVVFLAIVAMNILDRDRRRHLTEEQRRAEDEEAANFHREW